MLLALLMVACGRESTISYSQFSAQPPMSPNYADITIPCNIAPLNFEIDSVERIEVLV